MKNTFLNLPEAKRGQIERAAMEEFSSHSYSKASLSRLAQSAGISKGSLYQYFENKLSLFRWLLERAGQKKMEFMGPQYPAVELGFFDWLEFAFLSGLRFAVRYPRYARIALGIREGGDHHLRDFAREMNAAALAYMAGLLRDAQERGEVNADLDAEILAFMLVATRNSLFDVLRTRANVETYEGLFDDSVLAQFHEDELQSIVHQILLVFRTGSEVLPHPPAIRPPSKNNTPSATTTSGSEEPLENR